MKYAYQLIKSMTAGRIGSDGINIFNYIPKINNFLQLIYIINNAPNKKKPPLYKGRPDYFSIVETSLFAIVCNLYFCQVDGS